MKLTGISALVIAMLSAGAAHAAYTPYADATSFASATSTSLEDFADGTTTGITIARNSSEGGLYSITGGVFNDRVWRGDTPEQTTPISTTFTFATAITAFGGSWTLSANGYGQGLEFWVNGAKAGSIGGTDGFYGFTSTTAFSTVEIRAGALTGQPAETYVLDNLRFGSTVSAVPEPETYAMLLAGLGVVGWVGKRRQAK